MDLSCIISSGDLELYVMGLLSEEEAYKIEQLALLFPEIKAELDAISQSLEALAAQADMAPSPGVKKRLMEQLESLKATELAAAPAAPSAAETVTMHPQTHTTPVIPLQRKKWNPLLAASLIGLAICVGAIIYFARQNKQSNQQVATLQQQVTELQRSTNEQQQQLQAYNQTLQLWQSDDYRKIELTPVPGKPPALVQLFWNEKTNDVYVADISLPPAPSGSQYQLWAIVNGQPVDAGLLGNEKKVVQKMKAFESADAFAITLEKAGGSITPTMEAMYVMGKVS